MEKEKRGRKKKSYRGEKKTLYCGDNDAYEICKKKGINMSQEFTWLVQFLAYGTYDNYDQARTIFLDRIKMLKIARDKELEKINNYYGSFISSANNTLKSIGDMEEKAKIEENCK